MFGFARALKNTRVSPILDLFSRRFYITSKSAKNSVGTVETVFVMTFFSVAVLGPAGWILSNSCNSLRGPQ